MNNSSLLDPQGTFVIHQNVIPKNEDPALQTRAESQNYSETSKVNGTLKVYPGAQANVENVGFSQFSSPSSRSYSASRYQKEGECDPRFNLSGTGLVQMPEMNNPSNLLKLESMKRRLCSYGNISLNTR